MARTEIITLTCDRCKTDDENIMVRMHQVSIDGLAYDIDLCDPCMVILVELFSGMGRLTRKTRTQVTGKRTVKERKLQANMRAWGIAHGYELTNHGRLPNAVVKAYRENH